MPPFFAALVLVAPGLLLCVALLALSTSGMRPAGILLSSRIATLAALLLAVAATVWVTWQGPVTSPLLGLGGLGLSIRLDPVSCTMFLLVAFVGTIVVQYSRNYLDGDARQGAFIGGLCLTISAVLLLVLAGNLFQLAAAWIATSLSLHQLLMFYRERPAAVLAARKKFITARLGDTGLLGACVLLASAFGSSDIATILERARELDAAAVPASLQFAALLLACAALLKSAQFPTHGWLPEVMETPTPVSALLHAGIINAGGFLVIRFADVMLLSAPSLHVLAVVGGFTALFGSVVMLTQPSVKGSLAWSTVSQMGFMLLQCGFGAFSVALLHIVAHSLYKAHAFLSSGSVVELARSAVAPREQGTSRVMVGVASLGFAMALYVAMNFALASVVDADATLSPAVFTLGTILVLGVALFIAQSVPLAAGAGSMAASPNMPAMDAANAQTSHLSLRVLVRTLAAAAFATAAYFLLQQLAAWWTQPSLPAIPVASPVGLAIMGLAVLSFAIVALLQLMAPARIGNPHWRAARVHLANGLYVNAWFDRLVGALRRPLAHVSGNTSGKEQAA
ncbi:proton-conducting transporter membrane subunit [Thermomonas sp.]|uniref:proton-conducting transporter transmembrane domain-containing protein n=1 Tax=Thermomonas sp. TaxID=1971895 RepID=UPI002488151F|nr:proton-conducting transporter membrane subunit [Thermomonas sp.]MDI1254103.1 proton-conducting transporter membrane subunit [Thermomonas sp.]